MLKNELKMKRTEDCEKSEDLKDFIFGTKAETLHRLQAYKFDARLCPQLIVEYNEWFTNREKVVDQLKNFSKYGTLIVRSSSRLEDTETSSMAGAFESVMNVLPEEKALVMAVDRVFASYKAENLNCEHVLVQPMVEDVVVSGVIFSADIATEAPYVVLNYDDFSGRTDTVTGGAQSKLIYLRRTGENHVRSTRFRKLIGVLYELEKISGNIPIDVEFCINSNDDIYILQVRKLTVSKNTLKNKDSFHKRLNQLERQISKELEKKQEILGGRTIFGEMPDWNPAEIIGRTPTPLAATIYQELILKHAWATARSELGYKHVDHPLMIMLAGHPYIDVRLSLNSFLPKTIPEDLMAEIIDEQIQYLIDHPDAHDKVEFDVAMTCWDFNLKYRLDRLKMMNIEVQRVNLFEYNLQQHSYHLLLNWKEHKEKEYSKLYRLEKILNNCDDFNILDLLDSTEKLGTIPFAKLARHAFIATAILKSLVKLKVLSEARLQHFFSSISTITTEFVNDLHAVGKHHVDKDTFLTKYGHLRPGTYDIRVKSYREAPSDYISLNSKPTAQSKYFQLEADEAQRMSTLFIENDFPLSCEKFFDYAREAISGREKAKFIFTKGLSAIFDKIIVWGHDRDIQRDDLAFLSLDEILGDRSAQELQNCIAKAKIDFIEERRIRLPALVTEAADCDVIRVPIGRPTYVTSGHVSGPVVVLVGNQPSEPIENYIVAIESADPGYDWIFAHGIRGLITKYGGANSHMAIRCAELKIPAVIGCGERTFERIKSAGFVDFDCASDTIRFK